MHKVEIKKNKDFCVENLQYVKRWRIIPLMSMFHSCSVRSNQMKNFQKWQIKRIIQKLLYNHLVERRRWLAGVDWQALICGRWCFSLEKLRINIFITQLAVVHTLYMRSFFGECRQLTEVADTKGERQLLRGKGPFTLSVNSIQRQHCDDASDTSLIEYIEYNGVAPKSVAYLF